jgi:hypothetical protein
MSAGNMGIITLAANITSITITNSPTGGSVAFKFIQGAGSHYTVTNWPAGNGTSTLKVKWPGGTAPTITATDGAVDDVSCNVWSAYLWDCAWQGNFQ